VGLSLRLRADLSILGLSAIWGGSFVIVKGALANISPMALIAIRFLIASLALWPFLPAGTLGSLKARTSRALMLGGLVTGGLLFLGFTTQTIGLQHTTPSRSAFITGMYIIFTPLLSIALGLRRPALASFAGALLAVVGLALLTNPGAGSDGFGKGELLTLLCAVAFAGHLLAVDYYTRLFDKATIAFLQVAVTALLAAPAVLLEPIRIEPSGGLIAAILFASLIGTALAFLVLNLVQSWTTPTRAAIIFAAEPVFAGLASWAVEGEEFSNASLAGAALILAGMLTSELAPSRRGGPSESVAGA